MPRPGRRDAGAARKVPPPHLTGPFIGSSAPAPKTSAKAGGTKVAVGILVARRSAFPGSAPSPWAVGLLLASSAFAGVSVVLFLLHVSTGYTPL